MYLGSSHRVLNQQCVCVFFFRQRCVISIWGRGTWHRFATDAEVWRRSRFWHRGSSPSPVHLASRWISARNSHANSAVRRCLTRVAAVCIYLCAVYVYLTPRICVRVYSCAASIPSLPRLPLSVKLVWIPVHNFTEFLWECWRMLFYFYLPPSPLQGINADIMLTVRKLHNRTGRCQQSANWFSLFFFYTIWNWAQSRSIGGKNRRNLFQKAPKLPSSLLL